MSSRTQETEGQGRMSRRAFLRGAGAVSVLVAGGGVWRAADRGVFTGAEGVAYEPWATWRELETDEPAGMPLVRAGILAANPHNTQPWLFRVSDSSVRLYADNSRNLGSFDPYLREMTLGLGCAVENMSLAAAALGFDPVVTLGEGRLSPLANGVPDQVQVARVELRGSSVRDAERDRLYGAIPHRHTDRGPYDFNRPLASRDREALADLAGTDPDLRVVWVHEEPYRQDFGALIVEATEGIIADGPMVADSDRWFRHTRRDVQEHRDGVTLDAAGLPPLTTAVAKMLPQPSADQNHQYWLDATRDVHVATAPAFGLLLVRDLYDRSQNLRAGRLWQRMHLWATSRGLSMQPLNQPVELVDRERELDLEPRMARRLAELVSRHTEVGQGQGPWHPTFTFRAGYPVREAARSPRRPVDAVLNPSAGGI